MTESEILEKYRQTYPAITEHSLHSFITSAAVRRMISRKLSLPLPELTDQEIHSPVEPFFLDLEITTACQLSCRYCARTFMKVPVKNMSFNVFRKIIESSPNSISVNIVGLGEPLLHPELEKILHYLTERKIRTALVTNGMGLNTEKAKMLMRCGLDSITFSLDCIDPEKFSYYREGADIAVILNNIKRFMALKKVEALGMTASIFSVLQEDTLSGLGALAEVAASVNIPAIVISDLNFMENRSRSLSSTVDRGKLLEKLIEQMRQVASRGVVLIGPNILDSVSMADDWPTSILTRPEQILRRGQQIHQNCLAPLRTLVVRVDGSVNYCNCTPDTLAGTFASDSLEDIWWEKGFRNFRTALFSGTVPESCKICPRL